MSAVRLAVAALALAPLVATSGAQSLTTARAAVSGNSTRAELDVGGARDRHADTTRDRFARKTPDRGAARVTIAMIGGAAGLAAGCVAGSRLSGNDGAGSDGVGLCRATGTGLLASGVGTALLAALPEFPDDRPGCRSYGERLGRAYVGTLVGSLAGFTLGAVASAGSRSPAPLLIGVPAGQLIGASVMMVRCNGRTRR